ncbi:MAG TPA: SAM-dependent methyltransferase [Streptosporangiaceae bacterium]|nr:SAM-dependent methyltransferase [Streptosporangiaceae bacterium]
MAGSNPAGLDVTTPNIARMYDYMLDGKDNFAADRDAADQLIAMMPQLPLVARANRAFLRRAVRILATEYGIRQFIDIGTGLPTMGNVHEVARQAAPDTRVVYVDNDPVVCCHGRALLSAGATQIIQADLRHPEEILGHPLTRDLIDFDEPFALMFMSVLHFVPDQDDPQAVIARFRAAMAPGSFLVISHGTLETRPDDPRAQLSAEVYSQSSAPLALRSLESVRRLFDGFDLVEPGLVWISEWRPNVFEQVKGVGETLRGGVAQKAA